MRNTPPSGMVRPMNRKQVVDRESPTVMSATGGPTPVVVNAPTLFVGIRELARIVTALDVAHDWHRPVGDKPSAAIGRQLRRYGAVQRCGLTVVRRSAADPTLVAVWADEAVEAGAIVTEYLR